MKKSASMKDMFKLSFGEEVGNAISHGVMAFLYLMSMPIVCIYTYNLGGWVRGIGTGIYMICIFLMFLISCLYHSMAFDSTQKYVFRKLDHIAILLAIAGSYTPIALCLFDTKVGILILFIEWLAVFAGLLLKSISKQAHPILSGTIYLTMGWTAIMFLPNLIKNSTPLFLGLIVAGGLFYTGGVIFYAQKKKFFHFVWHLFINVACILHFIAIVFVM